MRTALDTNVLSALWSSEPSAARVVGGLASARAQGGLVVCAPVYVELLAHPVASQHFVDDFLHETGIVVEFSLDESIWRKAAESFVAYAQRRRRSGGGSPKRMLVDFVIAAHALLRADRLMTLDFERYRSDFPALRMF
jgi:predicted nucleic acid-binding protein